MLSLLPSYLKLQDIDYITGLALKIAERLTQKGAGPGIEPWLGKCLDLSKAYKQMAIHPSNRHLAVIFFHGQDGAPKFFVANSLMFGASAAVYSFNRVSRSLWFLLNKMLCIPCGVFYDDFPMFSPESQSDDADAAASQLLDLLGWRHAKTGAKALPFKPSFQVLGCSLNLEEICKGAILLENKPGRIDRINTIAKYAFSSSYVPGMQDEAPFTTAVQTALGRAPTVGELASLRRWFHECYALTASELKAHAERVEDAPVRKLAQPERGRSFRKATEEIDWHQDRRKVGALRQVGGQVSESLR